MILYQTRLILYYSLFLCFFIGLVMGSFLNCAAMRISHGESFIKGRSHCMSCGHLLGTADLVPLFSWLFLRGRCRYCGSKISARYPLTELIMGLASLCCLLRCDISLLALRNWLFVCVLFLLSLVDLEIMEIPDGCILVGIGVWAAFLPFLGNASSALKSGIPAMLIFGGGMLLLSLAMDKLLGKESMGGGDIKLIGMSALYLGVVKSLFMLILSCLLGLPMSFQAKNTQDKHFPFGPAIAGAVFVMLLWGDRLTAWYSALL